MFCNDKNMDVSVIEMNCFIFNVGFENSLFIVSICIWECGFCVIIKWG